MDKGSSDPLLYLGGLNVGINLSKGQRISLTKGNNLKNVTIGLGWETNKYVGSHDFDLDASVFLVNKNGQVSPDENFVFYNNKTSADGSVVHSGDNRSGGSTDSIEEEIKLDFSKISDRVDKIAVSVTIHEAKERRQNFGQVSNAFISLVDNTNGSELLRFNLDEEATFNDSVVFCELYWSGDGWDFKAVGESLDGGLFALCERFGLDVG